jgi:site-specific DNA recombinase
MAARQTTRCIIAEFNPEVVRRSAERRGDRDRKEAELRDIQKRLDAIVSAIEQGVLTETTRNRLLKLEAQKKELEDVLSEPAPEPYPSLHPSLARLYKRKVAALEEALADPVQIGGPICS